MEKDAPTGVANLQRLKRERKWAKKRAQIAAVEERRRQQYEKLARLQDGAAADAGGDDNDDAAAAGLAPQRQRKQLEKRPLDLKELDVSDNGIDDLGLARLVDVVRPDKTLGGVSSKGNSTGNNNNNAGFLVSLRADGNAKPLEFYRGKNYEDLCVVLRWCCCSCMHWLAPKQRYFVLSVASVILTVCMCCLLYTSPSPRDRG